MEPNSNISIIITNLNDDRIFNLINTLQHLRCFEIIVADGGSSKDHQLRLHDLNAENLKVFVLPGPVAVTRHKVTPLIAGDITVFIDTDELPSDSEWLWKLVAPIQSGSADFTFGPTKPMRPASNRIARYTDLYDEWMYSNILPVDISKGAMGNSAWKTEIIKRLDFDTALMMGGEDYDMTIRALQAGYRGVFVPEAVLLHDQNNIKTLWRFLRKKFSYLLGAALAYKKNKISGGRIQSSIRGSNWRGDPLEIIVIMMKPFAFVLSQAISLEYLRRKASKRYG
jgi:cellulose synthase/poly-beta-1,6-N-acetylglucosamine synthase-like glycosyltransferase